MTLYSPEFELQPTIGGGAHWQLFTNELGSALHQALVVGITPYLSQTGDIYSRRIGYAILPTIANQFATYDPDMLGSLLGMTVWNMVAEHEEGWFFRPDTSPEGRDSPDERGGYIYRRLNDD
jgi:hypothetical protein